MKQSTIPLLALCVSIRLGTNLVRFGGSFGFFRFGRFEVRFWGPKGRFGRFEVRFKSSANLPNLFKPGKLPDIDTIFSKSLREKFLKVGFPSDGSNCKIRFDPTLVFSFKKSGPFFSEIIP